MLKEIITIANPGKKKRGRPKKKTPGRKPGKKSTGRKPTKKRKINMAAQKKKAKPRKKAAKKRPLKRNPSNRGGGGRTKGILYAKAIGQASVDALKGASGMLIAQFFANKFADGGGAVSREWTTRNYLFATLGSFVGGVGAELIKKGSGKHFLTGGLSFVLYKLAINEVVPRSDFLMENLGQDAFGPAEYDDDYDFDEYEVGKAYLGTDGSQYVWGEDGIWHPVDESGRLPGSMGQYAHPSGTLAPVTALGQPEDPGARLHAPTSMGRDPFAEKMGAGMHADPVEAAFQSAY